MSYFYDKGTACSSLDKPYTTDNIIEYYAKNIIKGFEKFKKENRIFEHPRDQGVINKNTIFIINTIQRDYDTHPRLSNRVFLKTVCTMILELRGVKGIRIN